MILLDMYLSDYVEIGKRYFQIAEWSRGIASANGLSQTESHGNLKQNSKLELWLQVQTYYARWENAQSSREAKEHPWIASERAEEK